MIPTNYMVKRVIAGFLLLFVFFVSEAKAKDPVDYVNPYMGNISHLLVPTYPTIQLPNGMMRIFPSRGDYTGDRLNGLPLMVTNHRRAFTRMVDQYNLSPLS